MFLNIDASTNGLGAVLFQGEGTAQHVVSFTSCTLLSAECCYPVMELKALAIVCTIDYHHHYLFGQSSTVVTDHHGLCYLQCLKNPITILHGGL